MGHGARVTSPRAACWAGAGARAPGRGRTGGVGAARPHSLGRSRAGHRLCAGQSEWEEAKPGRRRPGESESRGGCFWFLFLTLRLGPAERSCRPWTLLGTSSGRSGPALSGARSLQLVNSILAGRADQFISLPAAAAARPAGRRIDPSPYPGPPVSFPHCALWKRVGTLEIWRPLTPNLFALSQYPALSLHSLLWASVVSH